ncbi:hypothetical protein F5148DRAFT_426246 [Russula earlei]|uniref:Uncharacterized protein n=1 Tax=Russula earlei TaxID=71964 RepID=A0ACC0U0Z2_9AGAM|nr:hypothetical protein F5148DRAFT_426246 [Russula earlei]
MSAPALPSSRMDVEGRQGIPPADADNGNENAFESASSKVWKLYEVETDKYDTELAGTWKGVTDAMLIFTGLFSAVVSAFIIETYKMLLPDNGGATVALLTQLVTQSQPNGGNSATSSAIPSTVTSAFTPSGIAIRINILMFLSLFLSLTCALMSTLIQQWAREYLQYSQLSAPPQKRGRVRAYLFEGLTKFQMRRMVESIPVLLHISVFLFFFAFSEFLRTINHTVGVVARCCVTILLSAYLVLSALPLVVSSSPYQTALTTPLRPCFIFLRFIVRFPLQAMKGLPPIVSSFFPCRCRSTQSVSRPPCRH